MKRRKPSPRQEEALLAEAKALLQDIADELPSVLALPEGVKLKAHTYVHRDERWPEHGAIYGASLDLKGEYNERVQLSHATAGTCQQSVEKLLQIVRSTLDQSPSHAKAKRLRAALDKGFAWSGYTDLTSILPDVLAQLEAKVKHWRDFEAELARKHGPKVASATMGLKKGKRRGS